MSRHGVVIVGASVAGVTCADRLRTYGFDGPITLVERETELPYDKPPLSKKLLTERRGADDIRLRPVGHYASQAIDLRLGCEAVSFDAGRHVLLTESGEIAYDILVVASGVAAASPPGLEHVPTLRSLGDTTELAGRWSGAESVAVIGGGFLGLELAASARTLGHTVDVVEPRSLPLAHLVGKQMGEQVARIHRQAGTTLHLGAAASSIISDAGWTITLIDGTVLRADDAVMSVGTVATARWLTAAGLGGPGGVACDHDGRTAVRDVFAVGDVAAVAGRFLGETLRVEHWSNALDTADAAARTIAGRDRSSLLPVPYFWSHQFGHRFQMVGRARPSDEVACYPRPGRPAGEASLTVYARDGQVSGALAHNWPTMLTRARQHLRPHTRPGDFVESVLPAATR